MPTARLSTIALSMEITNALLVLVITIWLTDLALPILVLALMELLRLLMNVGRTELNTVLLAILSTTSIIAMEFSARKTLADAIMV